MLLLKLQPSRIELVIVSLLHIGTMALLFNAGLSIALLLLPGLLSLAGFIDYCLRRADYRHVDFVSAFFHNTRGNRYKNSGRVRHIVLAAQHSIVRKGSYDIAMNPPGVSYYSEFLIVLRFTSNTLLPVKERPVSLVIWYDSLSQESNRSLRQYLRFDCPQQV
ncbi:MAG: hypothetical protein COA96_09120 [SAR86 cluster bacterium]|uniref:Uncharacterized protein n=1 Tax=SAR86 cluster bacterium TaxID=2030880 RepID=A0A2A5AZ49_9GAMM|nr:MAG: hypothetical protein COA96_09120 [SAR86 cluster bacterium]